MIDLKAELQKRYPAGKVVREQRRLIKQTALVFIHGLCNQKAGALLKYFTK